MAISGFLFLSWRIFEIIMLIPPVGMLAWFVHGFVENNQLTPNFVLVLFIVVVLALAWAFFTTISYLRARHDALFVAFVDLGFVGALIAGVVVLRDITKANCSDNRFSQSPLWANLGPFGLPGYQTGNPYAANINKNCSMLKASFAFAILCILAFFLTFVRIAPPLPARRAAPLHFFPMSLMKLLPPAPRPPRLPQPQGRRSRRRQARVPHHVPQPPSFRQRRPPQPQRIRVHPAPEQQLPRRQHTSVEQP